MSYQVKHRPKARQELEECREIYPGFAADLDQWISQLAMIVKNNSISISLDLAQALDIATSEPGAWNESMRKWMNSSNEIKVKALLTVLRKRCPPWEVRVGVARISFLSMNV